ncbi:MAG: hypothetical protein WBI17_06115 [Clostridiaceae bacterium]
MKTRKKPMYNPHFTELEVFGQKWDRLQNKGATNSLKEIQVLKKKIEYLKEMTIYLEDQLSMMSANRSSIKENQDYIDEAAQRLEELKNSVGKDMNKQR